MSTLTICIKDLTFINSINNLIDEMEPKAGKFLSRSPSEKDVLTSKKLLNDLKPIVNFLNNMYASYGPREDFFPIKGMIEIVPTQLKDTSVSLLFKAILYKVSKASIKEIQNATIVIFEIDANF